MNMLTEKENPHSTQPPSANLVLSTTRQIGWFKTAHCYLVFHDSELLFVHLNKKNVKSAAMEYREEQKAQGKGLLRVTLAMAGFWRDYGNRYYGGSREDLLALDGENFALSYADITRLVFKTARTTRTTGADDNFREIAGKLIIQSDQGKMKFSHGYFDRNRKIKGVLQRLLGKSLSYMAPFLQREISFGSSDVIN